MNAPAAVLYDRLHADGPASDGAEPEAEEP